MSLVAGSMTELRVNGNMRKCRGFFLMKATGCERLIGEHGAEKHNWQLEPLGWNVAANNCDHWELAHAAAALARAVITNTSAPMLLQFWTFHLFGFYLVVCLGLQFQCLFWWHVQSYHFLCTFLVNDFTTSGWCSFLSLITQRCKLFHLHQNLQTNNI